MDDENVSACSPPLSARLRRTARRHRTVATSLSAAVFAGILVATVASAVVADKNARLNQTNLLLITSNREVRTLNASLDMTNRELNRKNKELDATNVRLEETNRTLDNANRELARASDALRSERDRLELALQVGFKLLRGIENDQYHSLDDAYSDIVQNGIRLPDDERSAMLPLYLALVSMQKADAYLMQEASPDSGLGGLLNNVTSKAAAATEVIAALEHLNMSIEQSEKVGLTWLLRAQLRMEFLQHPKLQVLDDWNHAVALLPRCSAVFSGRGWNLIGLKRFDTAVADLQRAVELDSGNEYAHYGLAEIMLNRQNYAEAIEHYCAALELPQRYSSDAHWKSLLYEGTAYSYWGRAQQRLSDEDIHGSVDDILKAIHYCPAKDRTVLWNNALLILSQARADHTLVERLKNTYSVAESTDTAASFLFARDCIAALLSARAGTLDTQEAERLSTRLNHEPGLRAEISDAFQREFLSLAHSEAISADTREPLIQLILAIRGDNP